MCGFLLPSPNLWTHLRAGRHGVVRNDVLADVFDRPKGILHQVRREGHVTLHYTGDLVYDWEAGCGHQFLRVFVDKFFTGGR